MKVKKLGNGTYSVSTEEGFENGRKLEPEEIMVPSVPVLEKEWKEVVEYSYGLEYKEYKMYSVEGGSFIIFSCCWDPHQGYSHQEEWETFLE